MYCIVHYVHLFSYETTSVISNNRLVINIIIVICIPPVLCIDPMLTLLMISHVGYRSLHVLTLIVTMDYFPYLKSCVKIALILQIQPDYQPGSVFIMEFRILALGHVYEE